MRIGDIYEGPRHGRRYRVLRFDNAGNGDVVLWDETFKNEERAHSVLMVPANGWTCVESLAPLRSPPQ
jgi:hypothetical protein